MKDIRWALRALLLGDATVSGLVGGERIHPITLPQGQKRPSIVFNRISEGADYHMQGDSGLAETRMQIDSWAQTEAQSVELANAVYDTLSGHTGIVPFGTNSPQEEIRIHAIFMDTGREDFDASAELFRMSRDYIIRYHSL